jgi:hypothetical protein
MRLMVYAMQSSGASLFTYFLAQRPGSLAIVDVFATSMCPSLETDDDVLVKCTIAVDHKFDDHAERFRPDATLLFLRDPVQNYLSLRTHWYRDHGGRIDDKFRLLEESFRTRARFTAVIDYEDFVTRRPELLERVAVLWPIEASYFDFPRSPEEVARSCLPIAPPGERWGMGNVHGRNIAPAGTERDADAETRRHVEELCPELCANYEARRAGRT